MSGTAERTAKLLLDGYLQSSLEEHHAAMACRDCEDLLTLGIDAFEWAMRADRQIQADVLDRALAGEKESSLARLYEAQAALRAHLQRWLEFSQRAFESANVVRKTGYAVENLDAFERCCKEVQGILQSDPEFFAGGRMVELRDAALLAHERGEVDFWLAQNPGG